MCTKVRQPFWAIHFSLSHLASMKHIFIPCRETGALCAMKEADIFFDDPKSAESIKQLEQVFPSLGC